MTETTCDRYVYGCSVLDWLVIGAVSVYCLFKIYAFLPSTVLYEVSTFKLPNADYRLLVSFVFLLFVWALSAYKLIIRLFRGKNYVTLMSDGVEILIQGVRQKRTFLGYDLIDRVAFKNRKTIFTVYAANKKYVFSSREFENYFIFEIFFNSILKRSNIEASGKNKFLSLLK